MDFEPEIRSRPAREPLEFAEPPQRKPLELLRDTERSLRIRTVDAIVPLLPPPVADNLQEVSEVAEDSLEELADIDLEAITDEELKPARMRIGLLFIAFAGLMVMFLLFYLSVLHPELNATQQIRAYWYQYVWFVSLGVAGLAILGREAMRPPNPDD